MWHRILTTKLHQWSHSTIHTFFTFLLSKIPEPAMQSLCTEILYRASPQTGVLLLQSPKRRRNRSIPVILVARRRDPRLAGDPGRGPALTRLPVRTTYFMWEAREAGPVSSSSALAPRGCLRSLKPFPQRWRNSVSGGILRPKPRGQEGGQWAFTFSGFILIHDHSTLAVWQVSLKFKKGNKSLTLEGVYVQKSCKGDMRWVPSPSLPTFWDFMGWPWDSAKRKELDTGTSLFTQLQTFCCHQFSH